MLFSLCQIWGESMQIWWYLLCSTFWHSLPYCESWETPQQAANGSNTMSVWNYKTGRHYLIDTREIYRHFLLLPLTEGITKKLFAAANDSKISTLAQKSIIVHPGSCFFAQLFYFADICQPILLAYFSIFHQSDIYGHHLIDSFFFLSLSINICCQGANMHSP